MKDILIDFLERVKYKKKPKKKENIYIGDENDEYYSGPDNEDFSIEDYAKKHNISQKETKLVVNNEKKRTDNYTGAYEKFKSRRSIRKFSPDKIDWEIIYKIIDGGLNAPCAGGVENSDVVVITDKETKDEIGRIENQQFWLSEAPYVLVVVRDNAKHLSLYPGEGELYSVQSSAAVIENILMLAHFYDLGACWVESGNTDSLKELLGIPLEKCVDGVIPIGFPQESPVVEKSLFASRVFYEKYGARKRK